MPKDIQLARYVHVLSNSSTFDVQLLIPTSCFLTSQTHPRRAFLNCWPCVVDFREHDPTITVHNLDFLKSTQMSKNYQVS
jgi:hypothetical protein